MKTKLIEEIAKVVIPYTHPYTALPQDRLLEAIAEFIESNYVDTKAICQASAKMIIETLKEQDWIPKSSVLDYVELDRERIRGLLVSLAEKGRDMMFGCQ